MRTRLTVFACALLVSAGALRVPASSGQATAARPAPAASDDVFQASVKPFLTT